MTIEDFNKIALDCFGEDMTKCDKQSDFTQIDITATANWVMATLNNGCGCYSECDLEKAITYCILVKYVYSPVTESLEEVYNKWYDYLITHFDLRF